MAGESKDPKWRSERARKGGYAAAATKQRRIDERDLAHAVELVVTQADRLTATQLYALRVVLPEQMAASTAGDGP